MKRRIREVDPILYPLNDDGQQGITVIIHGAARDYVFAARADPDRYRCFISEAQLSGQVYLLSWRSGYWSYSSLRRIANFHSIEDNAHRLGRSLQRMLLSLPAIKKQQIRLVWHSLGAQVITSSLLHDEWRELRLRDAILMGAAIVEEDYEGYSARQFLRRCASQVRGRVVIC